MKATKDRILNELSYTELVYGRIRKKLGITKSNEDIEEYILELIEETPLDNFIKRGKNYYIHNRKQKVRMTINSYTTRIITADKI